MATRYDKRALDDTAPTLIAIAEDADAGHLGDHVVRIPRSDRRLNLHALLKVLVDPRGRLDPAGRRPTLAGSFLADGLVDRLVAYIAPVTIGGGGKAAVARPGAPSIGDAKRFRLLEVTRIGPDVRLTAEPIRG